MLIDLFFLPESSVITAFSCHREMTSSFYNTNWQQFMLTPTYNIPYYDSSLLILHVHAS